MININTFFKNCKIAKRINVIHNVFQARQVNAGIFLKIKVNCEVDFMFDLKSAHIKN